MQDRSCLSCNVIFKTKQYNKTYCSKKCQRLSKINRKIKYQSEYYQKNIEKRKQYELDNKTKIAKTNSEWYIENKDIVKAKIKEREKQYIKNNLNYLIAKRLRTRLNCAIKNNQKTGSAITDLGCSVKELIIYLESKFQPGMTWNNYGKWHIDHIKPLANYDLTDSIILKELCNYKNLQPLWAIDNLRKTNKESL